MVTSLSDISQNVIIFILCSRSYYFPLNVPTWFPAALARGMVLQAFANKTFYNLKSHVVCYFTNFECIIKNRVVWICIQKQYMDLHVKAIAQMLIVFDLRDLINM